MSTIISTTLNTTLFPSFNSQSKSKSSEILLEFFSKNKPSNFNFEVVVSSAKAL
ncbi:DUF4783 domain-containing protein [Aquimarina sp. AU58]|uniref:DUF4783 domain-containing protein n=1 Tax=Aquimarina sp. AU58 TaxID=1874112 RepID=UPI0013581CD7